MASRKRTFTLPEDSAAQFLRSVPAQDRQNHLICACDVANADPEVLAIEREWDALADDVGEPGTDTPAR
jgi:hypothetical protein